MTIINRFIFLLMYMTFSLFLNALSLPSLLQKDVLNNLKISVSDKKIADLEKEQQNNHILHNIMSHVLSMKNQTPSLPNNQMLKTQLEKLHYSYLSHDPYQQTSSNPILVQMISKRVNTIISINKTEQTSQNQVINFFLKLCQTIKVFFYKFFYLKFQITKIRIQAHWNANSSSHKTCSNMLQLLDILYQSEILIQSKLTKPFSETIHSTVKLYLIKTYEILNNTTTCEQPPIQQDQILQTLENLAQEYMNPINNESSSDQQKTHLMKKLQNLDFNIEDLYPENHSFDIGNKNLLSNINKEFFELNNLQNMKLFFKKITPLIHQKQIPLSDIFSDFPIQSVQFDTHQDETQRIHAIIIKRHQSLLLKKDKINYNQSLLEEIDLYKDCTDELEKSYKNKKNHIISICNNILSNKQNATEEIIDSSPPLYPRITTIRPNFTIQDLSANTIQLWKSSLIMASIQNQAPDHPFFFLNLKSMEDILPQETIVNIINTLVFNENIEEETIALLNSFLSFLINHSKKDDPIQKHITDTIMTLSYHPNPKISERVHDTLLRTKHCRTEPTSYWNEAMTYIDKLTNNNTNKNLWIDKQYIKIDSFIESIHSIMEIQDKHSVPNNSLIEISYLKLLETEQDQLEKINKQKKQWINDLRTKRKRFMKNPFDLKKFIQKKEQQYLLLRQTAYAKDIKNFSNRLKNQFGQLLHDGTDPISINTTQREKILYENLFLMNNHPHQKKILMKESIEDTYRQEISHLVKLYKNIEKHSKELHNAPIQQTYKCCKETLKKKDLLTSCLLTPKPEDVSIYYPTESSSDIIFESHLLVTHFDKKGIIWTIFVNNNFATQYLKDQRPLMKFIKQYLRNSITLLNNTYSATITFFLKFLEQKKEINPIPNIAFLDDHNKYFLFQREILLATLKDYSLYNLNLLIKDLQEFKSTSTYKMFMNVWPFTHNHNFDPSQLQPLDISKQQSNQGRRIQAFIDILQSLRTHASAPLNKNDQFKLIFQTNQKQTFLNEYGEILRLKMIETSS